MQVYFVKHYSNKLKDNADFIEILESHLHFRTENNNKNHEIVLQFLFSFHTFNLFHACLTYLLSHDNMGCLDDHERYSIIRETFMNNKKLLIDEISKK